MRPGGGSGEVPSSFHEGWNAGIMSSCDISWTKALEKGYKKIEQSYREDMLFLKNTR